MKALISFDLAKKNLKVENSDEDENLLALLNQASTITIAYLKKPETTYDAIAVPDDVQAMTMLVLRSLWDDPTADPITKAVESIGRRLRDPAFA